MSADRVTKDNGYSKFEPDKTQEKLPSYLSSVNGKFIFDPKKVIEGGAGEYDAVWDFGTGKDRLRREVPPSERITSNKDDIKYLCFEDPSIRVNMAKITEIANDPGRSPDDPADRKKYREHLGEVYKKLAHEVKEKLRGEKALFFSPKNGGIYVQDVFTREGFPPKDFYDYRMSRVLAKDEDGREHLNVSAQFASGNPRIGDYRTFVVADDCLASDISCYATLDLISSELRKKGTDPSEARAIISVSAATQRGLESLLSEKTKMKFGFGKIEAVAAMPVYKMTDKFYLQELDGRFTVGDMGKWTIRP